MVLATIYQKGSTPTQSGRKNADMWILKFVPKDTLYHYDVMGWNANTDMLSTEITLKFDSLEKAVKYATDNNISYEVIKENPRRALKPKSYLENLQ